MPKVLREVHGTERNHRFEAQESATNVLTFSSGEFKAISTSYAKEYIVQEHRRKN